MRLLPTIFLSHLLLLSHSDDSVKCYCGNIVLHVDADLRILKKETTSCHPGDKAYNKAHLNGKCYMTIVAKLPNPPVKDKAVVEERTITIYFNKFDVYNRIFDSKPDKLAIINHHSEKRNEWSFTFKCEGEFCIPNVDGITSYTYLVPSNHEFANNLSNIAGYEMKRYTLLKTMYYFASSPPKFQLTSKTAVQNYRTASICYCGKVILHIDVRNTLLKKEVFRCYPGKDAYYPDALNGRCYITFSFVGHPENMTGGVSTATMYFNKFDVYNRLLEKNPIKNAVFNSRLRSVYLEVYSFTFSCMEDYCTPNFDEITRRMLIIPAHHNYTGFYGGFFGYEICRDRISELLLYFTENLPNALSPTTTTTTTTSSTETMANAVNPKPTNRTSSSSRKSGKRSLSKTNNRLKMLTTSFSKVKKTIRKKQDKGNRWY